MASRRRRKTKKQRRRRRRRRIALRIAPGAPSRCLRAPERRARPSFTNLSGLLGDPHVKQRALGLGDGLVDFLVREPPEISGLGRLRRERCDGRGAAARGRGEGCCAPGGGREGGSAHGVSSEGEEGGGGSGSRRGSSSGSSSSSSNWENATKREKKVVESSSEGEKKNSFLLWTLSSSSREIKKNMSRAEPCVHAQAWAAARGGPAQAYLPIQRCLVEEWREARARAAASNIVADEVGERRND